MFSSTVFTLTLRVIHFLYISYMYQSIFVFYRPPYSPDASLDATYALINRYWTQIYRNASMLPELCAHLPNYSNNSHALSDSAVASSQSVSLMCPTCIASMRLISITGGTTFIFLFFTKNQNIFPVLMSLCIDCEK